MCEKQTGLLVAWAHVESCVMSCYDYVVAVMLLLVHGTSTHARTGVVRKSKASFALPAGRVEEEEEEDGYNVFATRLLFVS